MTLRDLLTRCKLPYRVGNSVSARLALGRFSKGVNTKRRDQARQQNSGESYEHGDQACAEPSGTQITVSDRKPGNEREIGRISCSGHPSR